MQRTQSSVSQERNTKAVLVAQMQSELERSPVSVKSIQVSGKQIEAETPCLRFYNRGSNSKTLDSLGL